MTLRSEDVRAVVTGSSRGIGRAIAPGFENTEMVRRIPDKIRERIVQQMPLKRLGEPEEIAAAAAFLASNEASYITGQVIDVNGGYRI